MKPAINDILELEFEKFRKLYKGTKRGHDTELKVLKKHKDWREVIPQLVPLYEGQLLWREKAKKAGIFVPEHAHLQTWLNQRRWEVEFPEINEGYKPHVPTAHDKW